MYSYICVHVRVQAFGYWGQEEITKQDFHAAINRYCTEQVLRIYAPTLECNTYLHQQFGM